MVELEILATSTVPDLFSDCPDEYTARDIKYINCSIPVGQSPCVMLKVLNFIKFNYSI